MTKLKNIILWLIALQLFLPVNIVFSSPNQQQTYKTTYKIGVLAYKGKEDAIRKWSAHAGYLNRKISQLKFEIVPLSYKEDEMTNAVKSKLVDFIITNPGHFTELQLDGHVVHLATRRVEGPLGILDKFGGTAIAQANRTDLNSYSDLVGKKILIPSKSSLGGWQVHLREGLFQNIDLRTDAEIVELKSHVKVIEEILKGNADAGFIRSDLIEELDHKRKLDPKSLKIIHPVNFVGYPYRLSTRLYPEWPFAMVVGVNPEHGAWVLHALLEMNRRDPAAIAANLHSWTIPGNYSEVNDLFFQANLGPYKKEALDAFAVLNIYWKELLIVISIFIISLLWFALKASKARHEMIHEKFERQIAERSNIEKSQFLANMSHELRTPMHAIIGFTNIALKNSNDEKIHHYLDNIHLSANRLTNLLNDLLDLSKLEAGKMNIELADHDVVEIIKDSISEIGSLLEEKNLNIHFDSGSPVICKVDKKLFTQVILNLLSNAIKFSPEDGKISINIIRKKSKKLNNVAETVEITVQDEGMGIPKDQLELVFDQFEQSSNTNSNAGGTGLGLAISKKIIESHNGLIWAESPPEGKTFGAVLYIQLPAINS